MKALELANSVLSLNDPGFDYCIENLRTFLKNVGGLIPETNPVLEYLPSFDIKTLEYIIVDYSHFSNEAIHYLLDADIRVYPWDKVKKAVDHNILEEEGLYTRGVPHLEMMREGYRKDLNIETVGRGKGFGTHSFLEKMRRIFRSNNHAFLTGALVALESTAVPEFYILDKIVTRYVNLKGMETYNGLTREYIEGHKTFEVGHEQDLIDAAANYISCGQEDPVKKLETRAFKQGFVAVCLTLSDWWRQMAFDRQRNHLTGV